MAAPSTTREHPAAKEVQGDLEELASLLGETLRGLKQASPPPPQLLDAVQDGSLGPRHMSALLSVAAANL